MVDVLCTTTRLASAQSSAIPPQPALETAGAAMKGCVFAMTRGKVAPATHVLSTTIHVRHFTARCLGIHQRRQTTARHTATPRSHVRGMVAAIVMGRVTAIVDG